MVLEWTREEASLRQDRPFSAAVSVHLKRSMGDSALVCWIPEDQTLYETCVLVSFTLIYMCIIIETLHHRPLCASCVVLLLFFRNL